MRNDRGFRIPEARDKYIQWPARGSNTEVLAVYAKESASWAVPGVSRVYGSPLELVQQYGNDWYVLSVFRAPEGER